ncbi:MAG: glycosyltransferase family 2 protein [bacterium]
MHFQVHGRRSPFVSIILPTRNRAMYLEGALRAAFAQNYPPERFEVIVVDNASVDDTSQLVRMLAGEVEGRINMKYIRESRAGLVFARHTGAAHAEGEILLFGDDDAIYSDNWISEIVEVYLRYPEVGAVGTKIEIQWDRDPAPWVLRHERVLGKLDYGPKVLVRHGLYINGGSFSIRKQILLQAKGFNPGQKGDYIIGDSETGLCRKLASHGIIVGWTPAATMWHIQRADVHGTLHDMKRRFRNNGICEAYYATFYNRRFNDVLYDIFRRPYRVLRNFFCRIRHMGLKEPCYELRLEIAYYIYYIKYLYLYRFNRAIRSEVMRTQDWEFSHSYEAPPVEFTICHLG